MSNFPDLSQPDDRELSLGPTTANVPVPDSSQSMTPQQEREYVEAAWESLDYGADEFGNYSVLINHAVNMDGVNLAMSGIISPSAFLAWFREETEDAAWHAAFLFTKERKRYIAEVEEEIDLLRKVWPAYYPSDSATMERIVDVEKARLAELKRGLREVPRG